MGTEVGFGVGEAVFRALAEEGEDSGVVLAEEGEDGVVDWSSSSTFLDSGLSD